MPLPTPHPDEKESDFVSRCMSSEAAKEFKDEDQRLAVCYSQFRKGKDTKASRRMEIEASVEFDFGGD